MEVLENINKGFVQCVGMVEVMASKIRFRTKKHSTDFSVAWVSLPKELNPKFKKSPRPRTVLTV